MQLWNDYEGKTLAGTFPIETLLLTEGRNACFATHDREGRPAVLRLTEALNDQDEMRARYAAIRNVDQPNLVAIKDFGEVEMDGIPLIYLVMEATEENLAEIVGQRRLSLDETAEVALCVTSALEALHAHGLVHGKVEPASVLAAGQVIKLRSDCIRPAPEGAEGDRARAEDVFGLADVLNRSLTQQPLVDASDALALPEPYAAIVRNVTRGNWGIEQVAGELRRFARIAPPPQTSAIAPPEPHPLPSGPPAGRGSAIPAADLPLAPESAEHDLQLPLVYAETDSDQAGEPRRAGEAMAAGVDQISAMPQAKAGGMAAVWLGGAAAVLLLLFAAWHVTGVSNKAGGPGPAAGPAPAAAPALAPAPAAAPAAAAVPAPLSSAVKTAPAASAASPVIPLEAAGPSGAGAPIHGEVWRVVAFTYNVESQARAKAKSIAAHHAELAPQVYSRTGHAPFLVVLGGSLSRPQAAAMLQNARRQGLPRDVYMQNYSR